MNELEQLFSAAGDAGMVIVLAICTWLIVRVIMSSSVKIMGMWRDAAKERNAIDADRNTIDEKVADTLAAVSENLTHLKEATGETRDIVVGVRRQHETLHATAIENHNEIMSKLHPVLKGVTSNGKTIMGYHAAVVSRLDSYGEKIDSLLEKIDVMDVPTGLRGDITKLIELVTTVSAEVKALQPQSTTNTKNPASVVGYMGKQPKAQEK